MRRAETLDFTRNLPALGRAVATRREQMQQERNASVAGEWTRTEHTLAEYARANGQDLWLEPVTLICPWCEAQVAPDLHLCPFRQESYR